MNTWKCVGLPCVPSSAPMGLVCLGHRGLFSLPFIGYQFVASGVPSVAFDYPQRLLALPARAVIDAKLGVLKVESRNPYLHLERIDEFSRMLKSTNIETVVKDCEILKC